jgi:hypothetical protein
VGIGVPTFHLSHDTMFRLMTKLGRRLLEAHGAALGIHVDEKVYGFFELLMDTISWYLVRVDDTRCLFPVVLGAYDL